jgi:hypothetical protein
MKDWQKRDTRSHIRQHSLSVTVDHTIDFWELFEHFAMDEALRVALLRIGIDGRAIGDVVFDQIFRRRDDCRGLKRII